MTRAKSHRQGRPLADPGPHAPEVRPTATGPGSLLPEHTWQVRAEKHRARVETWTEPRRLRRARAQVHPVHDFLFDYYRYTTAKLAKWHPSWWESVEDSLAAREAFPPPHYRQEGHAIRQAPDRLPPKAVGRLRWTRELLVNTQSRKPWLGCYGVHEWAMVYGGKQIRHENTLGLRVTRQEIDRFVDEQPIVCTHFDAYRFFAPEARPKNRLRPRLDARADFEQPGCVHANMDLYKWAYKSMPWIGSDLLWEAFQLATQLRELDMRASPYDLTPFGYEAIPVEIQAGRAEYRRLQEQLSIQATRIRSRLIEGLDVAAEPLTA